MLRIVLALATVVALFPVCHAQSSPIEVLYVAEGPTNQPGTLLTYNVNPETAVAERVGNSLAVRATNVEPLSIGGKNLVYVWNSNAVWVYSANARGVPGTLLQHLIFGFAHPVFTFLVDPDGKFAYAIMTWFAGSQYRTSIVLFTIDQLSGKLSNTEQVVATYGPSYYVPMDRFLFGASGHRLYAFEDYAYAPFSCGGTYNYFQVNQTTGQLGKLTPLFGWGNCVADNIGTFTDTLTAVAEAQNGAGSGTLVITRTATGKQINCDASMVSFCGDDAAALNFDPASSNIFFSDSDTNQVSIGHIDFSTQSLIERSSIPGLPDLYFSPDSKVIYAVNTSDIDIYAFAPGSGNIKASWALPRTSSSVHIATATLK